MVATGLGMGNSVNMTTTDKDKFKSLKDTLLSNTSLTNTLQSMVAKTISQTIVSNKTNISSLLTLHNTINFVAGKKCPPMSGGFTAKNIDQALIIDSSIQSTKQTDIVREITSVVNNNINQNIKNVTSNTDSVSNKDKIGTTLGGVVDSAIGVLSNLSGTVGKVFSDAGDCAGIGNSCDTNITSEIDKELQDLFKLDNKFSLADAINKSNLASSDVTTEDITNIISEITNNNSILVKNVCPKFINIANVEQDLVISNVVKNNTILSLSLNIATNYINKIDKILDNINLHRIDSTNSSTNSDIAALGDATAAVIKSGGDAVSSVIDSSGKSVAHVAKTVGDTGSGSITKVGDSAGDALGGLGGKKEEGSSGPSGSTKLIAFLILCGLGWYFFVYKKKQRATIVSVDQTSSTSSDIGTASAPNVNPAASYKYLFGL